MAPINTHVVLWKIRRAMNSREEFISPADAEQLVEQALERVRRWMGGTTKTEVYALELMLDRMRKGDSMWMLGTLADAFLCYLQKGETAREPQPGEGEPDE